MRTRCGNLSEYRVQCSRPRVQFAIRVIMLLRRNLLRGCLDGRHGKFSFVCQRSLQLRKIFGRTMAQGAALMKQCAEHCIMSSESLRTCRNDPQVCLAPAGSHRPLPWPYSSGPIPWNTLTHYSFIPWPSVESYCVSYEPWRATGLEVTDGEEYSVVSLAQASTCGEMRTTESPVQH